MATGETLIIFTPLANEPPTSNAATLDQRNNRPVLDFDDTNNESAVFSGVMPASYGGSGLLVYLHFAMTSATTGVVNWEVAFERVGDRGQDLDLDGFAAGVQSANNSVPSSNGLVAVATVAVAAQDTDNIAAGDTFRMKVTRDAGTDTASGDAELLAVELREKA
jgi:hypothetical protein